MNTKRLIVIFGLLVGAAGYSQAAACDGSQACEIPGVTGLANPTANDITAASLRALQIRNSGTATANTTGSKLWFFAYAVSLPAPSDFSSGSTDFDETGNGLKIASGSPLTEGDATPDPANLLVNGRVNDVLASTNYRVYAQACRAAVNVNTSGANNCSNWVLVYASLTTDPLPTNVFIGPVPGDVTLGNVLSINIDDQSGIKVPSTDPVNAEITIRNVDSGNTDTLIYPITYEDPMTISNNGAFPSYSFLPNTQYRFIGRLEYPFTQFTTIENEGPFYSTPAQPGSHATPIMSVTHVTARVRFLNATAAPGNPTNTQYSVTFTASGCTTKTVSAVSTSNNPNEVVEAFTEGLSDGCNYTATVIAQNKGGGTWKDSIEHTITNINTIPWGLVLTVPPATVHYTSATANIAVGDASGLSHYYIRFAPLSEEAQVAWPGGLSVNRLKTGLTPNSIYTVTARMCEQPSATEYCSGQMPAVNAPAFATDVYAPTSGGFSNVLATSLQVFWTDPSANPAGSTYEAQLCTSSNFTTGCLAPQTANKPTMLVTFNVSPQTPYYGRVMTRNVSRPTWPDSEWLEIGSQTTPQNQSGIQVSPNPGSAIAGSPRTFTATVFDQSGIDTGLPVTWAYSNGDSQLSTTNGTATTLTATAAGNFTLTASRNGFTSIVVPVNVSDAGPVVSSVVLTVNPDNLTGDLVCSASDPGYLESQLTFTWSMASGPSAVSYSLNGTPAAKNTTVTFSQAGNYTFQCTVRDPGNLTASGVSTVKNVPQDLNSIRVCAEDGTCASQVTLRSLKEHQFSASGIDQFGFPMTLSGIQWGLTGAGNINSAGVFNSNAIGTTLTVTATANGKSGAINVLLVSFDVSNAKAYPVPFKASLGHTMITFDNLGSQATIHVYTTSGRRVFDIQVNSPQYDWDVKNSSGESLASGVYFYVIESPEGKKNGKLIIIK